VIAYRADTPDGFPLWVSPVEPSSVHDLTAGRIHARSGKIGDIARAALALTDAGHAYIT